MSSLHGKIAVVTGAARGIGRAVSDLLIARGASVAMVDLAVDGIPPSDRVLPVAADVSKPADAGRVASETVARFGTIDILVNNAGIVRDQTLLKMTEVNWDAVVAVNLKGVFLCGQACAKVMSAKKYGKIVNVSSVARFGNFGQTNYSAAKAGVVGMTKTWALELSRFGINVNAVAPGPIATDMTATIPPPVREKLVSMIPLKRMGEPGEVAETILFLASDESAYVQGEVIAVDGGFHM